MADRVTGQYCGRAVNADVMVSLVIALFFIHRSLHTLQAYMLN